MIRVLIVDDSPTLRLLIRAILESDRELQVVGEARSGEEALGLCPTLRPDIVTMDINMPGMGGYEAIRCLMSEAPCPILVLTGIDSRHLLDVSFKALALGALMVVAKPEGMPDRDPEAQNLIVQVKTMAGVKVVRRPLWLQPQTKPRPQSPAKSGSPSKATLRREAPKLIAIGISTGGPPALQTLLSGLPPTFPVPIAVVQHISRGFVSGLANWLSGTTPFPCKVTSQSEILQPGQVYFAPDDRHLIIKPSGLVWLDASEPVGSHRPSATVLFQSVARNYGSAAIGVQMTGMGEDGARGLLAMRQAGAYTVAQDEASSMIFGMPKAAIELGAAEEVLALDQIAYRLQALTGAYK